MERGDITKRLAMIGEIAMSGDADKVQTTKNQMVMLIAGYEFLTPVADIKRQVDADIGYLAGYLPVDLGNLALQMFHVEHPVFGAQIPADMQHALEMGQKLGKQWAIKQQTEAERAKKVAQASDLGVMLPESDESVSNEDAARILAALKARKGVTTPRVVADPFTVVSSGGSVAMLNGDPLTMTAGGSTAAHLLNEDLIAVIENMADHT